MADTDNAVIATLREADRPAEPSTAKSGVQSGALSYLLPTFSEAYALVESPYSCLVAKTHRRPLALSPRYLNKKKSGIQEQLNRELLKYQSRLDGVPLAYDNVKIVGEFGDICDDVGYIQLIIQADFVIFQPKCGEKLVGVVNKVAPSHIGCLIHGCFNASVPKPFKMPIEAWQHVGVQVGDRMEFEVFRLDSDAVGVFFIRGKLDRKMEMDAIERLNEATKEQTSEVTSDTEKAPEDGADTDPKVIPEDTPKKKAKKRAFQETLLQNVTASQEGSGEMNTTLEETQKKKSKKRKYQEIHSQAEIDASIENISVEDSTMNNLYQLDDNVLKKVHKKKKHNRLLNVDSDNNNIGGEENSISGLDNVEHSLDLGNESLVPSSQEQLKKSKKKKRKDKSVGGLNESLQNGITEEPAITESPVAGYLGAEAETNLANLKKKHKKKHKQPSAFENPIIDSTNGVADFISPESLGDNLSVYQESPRQKKHKRKHLAPVLAESNDAAQLAVDRMVLPAASPEFAEPKAKRKRKE